MQYYHVIVYIVDITITQTERKNLLIELFYKTFFFLNIHKFIVLRKQF